MTKTTTSIDGIRQDDFDRLVELVTEDSYISPELYDKYNIKRGLRNKNGTGVLVGITKICSVTGYEINQGNKIPVEGELRYRGIDIFDIANSFIEEDRFGYEEVVYLLLFGALPTKEELQVFTSILDAHRDLPKNFKEDVILSTPSRNIMNKIQSNILSLYSYDDNPEDESIANVLAQSIDIIAKMPTIVSYSYQAKKHYFDNESLVLHLPCEGTSTAENMLRLCREDKTFSREEAQLLDLLLVVQAEHGGGNNSTFATQVISSSGTDTYSAIAAAVGSLKGTKHGGANRMVSEMVSDIKAHVSDWNDKEEVKAYVKKIMQKEAFNKKGLVYGMGHAVYTKSDPRAILLKAKAEELAAKKDMSDAYHLIANIEQATKELFRELRDEDAIISANVDLYSGLVFEMLNIPEDLYTPIFAAARIAGWCAHRLEQVSDGKIIRPAFVTLPSQKDYVPLAQRS